MTTFEFARDEALRFKVAARANKLLGLWAANLMGLESEAAASYAKDVVKSDFEEAGHEDVYRKVFADLDGRADEATVREKMEQCEAEAMRQIQEES